MRIEDDMNSVSEEELLNQGPWVPPWLNKMFVRVIAIFLILLMSSFVYLNYDVIGQLVSRPVIENELYLKNVTVVFEDEPLSLIEKSYKQELETPMCLQGSVMGNNYYITAAYIPAMYERSRTHVVHAGCVDSLILFHTHPYKSCLASATDINTLQRNQELDPDIIMIIMCEPNRYSLYD